MLKSAKEIDQENQHLENILVVEDHHQEEILVIEEDHTQDLHLVIVEEKEDMRRKESIVIEIEMIEREEKDLDLDKRSTEEEIVVHYPQGSELDLYNR